jgi:Bacteriophage lambda head decoration protein D
LECLSFRKAGTPASSSSPRATEGSRARPSPCSRARTSRLPRCSARSRRAASTRALDPVAVDGSEAAAGILYDAVDASAADAEGVAIVRLAEVNAAELVWPDGITAPQQTTALGELAALNIIAR